jgi:hypothetical protein
MLRQKRQVDAPLKYCCCRRRRCCCCCCCCFGFGGGGGGGDYLMTLPVAPSIQRRTVGSFVNNELV